MANRISCIAPAVLLGASSVGPVRTESPNRPLSWITGYWYSPPVYGGLPVEEIDYSALTHIIHFSVVPQSDGSLNPTFAKYVTDYAPDLIRTAHEHGVKVLLSVAQSGSQGDFPNATRGLALSNLITNIMDIVETYGYDGVDLDWETRIDAEQFANLVNGLRFRLDARTPRGLLTGAFWESGTFLARTHWAFDQVNIMAYDMCSPLDGFSWHNSALYDSGDWTRRTADKRINPFTAYVPYSKLGLGVPFYGYVWGGGGGFGGVTMVGQALGGTPKMTSKTYRDIVGDPTLWRDEYKRRDQAAGFVPVLSVSSGLFQQGGQFVTYDDEVSLAEKVRYVKSRGFAGIMIWELSGGYFPAGNPKHPLLQAVKAASDGF